MELLPRCKNTKLKRKNDNYLEITLRVVSPNVLKSTQLIWITQSETIEYPEILNHCNR